jgi:hypothetical protein
LRANSQILTLKIFLIVALALLKLTVPNEPSANARQAQVFDLYSVFLQQVRQTERAPRFRDAL